MHCWAANTIGRSAGRIWTLSAVLCCIQIHSSANAAAAQLLQVDQPPGRGLGNEAELKDLFEWAIKNSDQDELRLRAKSNSRSYLEKAKKAEIDLLLSEVRKEPSEKQLVIHALEVAGNATLTIDIRESALNILQYLLESLQAVDDFLDSNGVSKLLTIIINNEKHPTIQMSAALALGTAASNNPSFQSKALKNSGLVPILIKFAGSSQAAVSEKMLYAAGALVRSNEEGQVQFYAAAGVAALIRILQPSASLGQLQKALGLISDLADVHGHVQGRSSFADRRLMAKLLQLLDHPTQDVQERVLLALIHLAASPDCKGAIQAEKGLLAVRECEKALRGALRNADSAHAELYEHLIVMTNDLEDLLGTHDRTEL